MTRPRNWRSALRHSAAKSKANSGCACADARPPKEKSCTALPPHSASIKDAQAATAVLRYRCHGPVYAKRHSRCLTRSRQAHELRATVTIWILRHRSRTLFVRPPSSTHCYCRPRRLNFTGGQSLSRYDTSTQGEPALLVLVKVSDDLKQVPCA